MSKTEISKLLAMMAVFFPNMLPAEEKLLSVKVNAWHVVLGDLAYEEAKNAVVVVLNTCRYEPKPADIRDAVNRNLAVTVPTAEEAWREVSSKATPYGKIKWSHPVIEEAVKCMGIMTICASESGEWLMNSFCKLYNHILQTKNERQIVAISASNYMAIEANEKIKQLVNQKAV